MYCSKWNRDRSERSQDKTWRCGDQLFRFLDHNFGEYWRSIFKAVYSRSMFWHYRHSKCHISGNNVNVACIVVSLFCPGCALFEYVIKCEYISTDKWLNLTCAVTINTLLMQRGSSAVECRTHNRESVVRIPFFYRFEVWAFSFSPRHPSSLSCINEYLAIGSGGNVSDLSSSNNCCGARMLPREAKLVPEWTGLPGGETCVKRFEWSNRLDTALY